MPNLPSVNLRFLNRNKTGSAEALSNLATFANGPLRLQKKLENGITVRYLGVRSWSTYFFEKIIATPRQIAKAELKTRCAIEFDVRPFLNNGGLTLFFEPETVTASL